MARKIKSSNSRNLIKKQSGKKNSQAVSMEALKDFVRTRGAGFLKDPNITSVGIGYKQEDGKLTDEISIQFTVEMKAQPENLKRLGTTLIPKSFKVNGTEVPTDVIQRKYAAEFKLVSESEVSDRKRRMDPMVPGISISNVNGSAGTIGCLVYDKASGLPYILSNWHVLHGPNGAVGDDIVQPGPHDDNRAHLNRMGKLARSHLGHAGDCAITTIEDRGFSNVVIDLGISIDKIGEAELGDKVIKSGRTTGVTHGIVSRVNTIVKIDYGGSIGEQEIGGFEIGVDVTNPPDNGEISMGGDSGSIWIFKSSNGKPSGIMAGLHFAGESSGNPTEYAIACYPKSIFEKLEITLEGPILLESEPDQGFATDFLSVGIGNPGLVEENKEDMFVLNGSEIIDYTHFSLVLNKVRKFPFWVGWNIDGSNIKKISRSGIPFKNDPRIPSEFQAGDELYRTNKLDRGHIARRADLVWGTLKEAEKANKDSFYFTNISPQMEKFNQGNKGGIWGKLEDAVFEEVDVENLKVSLFGGPVFHKDDQLYRNTKLPREFWKIVMYIENEELKAKGFLLTQNLNELEALELDDFKVFQVTMTEIETRCGLIFDTAIKTADSFGKKLNLKGISIHQRKSIEHVKDIDWN
jgi:endonuclease G, mitochondrial